MAMNLRTKANDNHDERGRFASAGGGSGGVEQRLNGGQSGARQARQNTAAKTTLRQRAQAYADMQSMFLAGKKP